MKNLTFRVSSVHAQGSEDVPLPERLRAAILRYAGSSTAAADIIWAPTPPRSRRNTREAKTQVCLWVEDSDYDALQARAKFHHLSLAGMCAAILYAHDPHFHEQGKRAKEAA